MKSPVSGTRRPAISIEGIDSHFKHDVHLHIVRVATGATPRREAELYADEILAPVEEGEREGGAVLQEGARDLNAHGETSGGDAHGNNRGRQVAL